MRNVITTGTMKAPHSDSTMFNYNFNQSDHYSNVVYSNSSCGKSYSGDTLKTLMVQTKL